MNELAIWPFIFGMLSVYPFFILRHIPVMGRLKISFKRLMVYATVIMLVQGLSFVVLSRIFPFGASILVWHRKIFMFLYVALTIVFSKDNPQKVLFMDFLVICIVMAVIDTAYIIRGTWFKEFFEVAPYRTDVLVRISITILIWPPLYIIFKKYLKPIMSVPYMSVWRYMTVIPFVFVVILIGTTMESFGLEVPAIIIFIRFSIIIGSVLVCALLAAVVRQLQQAVKEQEKIKQSEQLLALQSVQYENMAKMLNQTRMFRHDVRHNLVAITALTKRKEFDKLEEFLERYKNSVPIDTDIILCENYAANSIISHYMATAKEQGVGDLDFKCVIAKDSKVDDVDLCVLLGNLLENAIEGCMTIEEKDRKIKMRVAQYVGEMLITIDNTFDGVCSIEDNEFISRKRKDNQKGVGLVSVATIVEKYNGDVSYKQHEGWFMVSVSLR